MIMVMVMVMVIMFRRRGETGIIGVFMHAVQKALDDAEGDEATDVDVGEVSAVLGVPLFDALALFEAGVEFDDGYAVDDLVGFFGAGCVGCCYCCGGVVGCCVVVVVVIVGGGVVGDIIAVYGWPEFIWVEW